MPPAKGTAKRCPVEGCKVRLDGANANTKCGKCGLAVCNNHMFPSDHDCASKVVAAPKPQLIVEKPQGEGKAAPAVLGVQKPNAKAEPAPVKVEVQEETPVVTSLENDNVEALVNEFIQAASKGRTNQIKDAGRLILALDFAARHPDEGENIIKKAQLCSDRVLASASASATVSALRRSLFESDSSKLAGCWILFAMLAGRGVDEAFYDDLSKSILALEKVPANAWASTVISEFLRFRSMDVAPTLLENSNILSLVESLLQKINGPSIAVAMTSCRSLAGLVNGMHDPAAIHNLKLVSRVPENMLPIFYQAIAESGRREVEPYVWKWRKGCGEFLYSKYTKGDPEVRSKALDAARAVASMVLGPVGCDEWVEALITSARDPINWRGREFSIDILECLVKKKPDLLHVHLPSMVSALAGAVVDAKKEVATKASAALDAVGDSVTNPETKRLMPFILDAIKRPDAGTDKCLSELMDATFVNALNATSVSLIVPVITRALREGSADLKRRGAIATGNVCALVRDVEDVRPFASGIRAELTKLKDHSSPEVRKAAGKASTSLEHALDQADSAKHAPRSPRVGSVNDSLTKEIVEELKESLFSVAELRVFASNAVKVLVENLMDARVRDVTDDKVFSLVTRYVAFIPAQAIGVLCSALLSRIRRVRSQSFEDAANSGSSSMDDVLVDIPDMILAYASRVLLNKTHVLLKRGHRYGIVGKIGVGKTTLASRLAKGDLENFPEDVSTYMVLHEVLQEDMGKTVHDYMGGTEEAAKVLKAVGFENPLTLVSTLSGGWRMRLAIAKSMLADADLIVLDEPTNHVDVAGCAWLASYLKGLNKTCVIVSHDYDFLADVATDVLHIHDHKLDTFEGTFSEFQKAFPEITAALPKMKNPSGAGREDEASVTSTDPMSREPTPFQPAVEASSDASSAIFDLLERQETDPESVAQLLLAKRIPVIRFPDPGKLEGITSKGKPVMTVTGLTYAYASNPEKVVLTDVSCKLSLNSRVALRGANGQGKSTLMKLIVGEIGMNEQSKGTVWKHHNLRVAYVAQHAIHHLMDHLDITPVQYLQRRYFEGRDKERGEMITLALDEEDKRVMSERGEICGIVSRVTRGKQLFYEIETTGRRRAEGRQSHSQKLDDSANAKEFRSLAQLEAMKKPHVIKLIKMFDEEVKYEASGLAIRPVTQVEVLKGLAEFGIDADFAERKIRWLSGGQKSRLVLAAAIWHKPHLICLDEPTNFLDAETLAVLTYSLKTFKGAVLTVSHHESFVKVLCNEAWDMHAGKLSVVVLKEKMKVGGGIVGRRTPGPDDEEESDLTYRTETPDMSG